MTRTVAELPAMLGDFRILREIGRGGMGVVYEAEQQSLNRRVALKVLPFAAALDPRRLARFRIEVQAAARLHHSNVVPMYAVGEEAGIHYAAMQLVEGRSLDAVIRELRQSAGSRGRQDASSAEAASIAAEGSTRSRSFFRAVAELGIQAAQALDHAHEMGVVHRDVKPSNMLVDATGKLWVTDFGLAELEGGNTESGSGDVVGTLRYASPEQLVARRAPVDHRTDVYSLGATLYELVGLQPAFPGRNRAELMRRVASDPPRRLKRLNPAVPVSLETIVREAMAKAPDERYASAAAVADDLRRFLSNRPIEARRPSAYRRSVQWVRRHRALSTAAAGVLVVLVAFLAASTAFLWQEREAKAAALRTADASAQRAAMDYRRTLSVVDQAVDQVGEVKLEPAPGLGQVRARMLREALEFYSEACDRRPDDLALRAKLGRICRFRARFLKGLGRVDPAEAAFVKAIAILDEVVASSATSPRAEADLVESHAGLGQLLGLAQHRRQEALPHLELAIARQSAIFARDPIAENRGRLIRLWLSRAEVQGREGKREARDRSLNRALDLHLTAMEEATDAKARRDLAALYNQIAAGRIHDGRFADAEQPLQKGVTIMRQLVGEAGGDPKFASEFGAQLSNLAIVLRKTGRPEEALELVHEAIQHQRRALESNRHHPQYRELLSNHYHNVAGINLDLGNHAAAAEAVAQLPKIRPQWLQSYLEGASLFIRCHAVAADDAAAAARYAQSARGLIDRVAGGANAPPGLLNKVARYLVIVPPEFQQPKRAVKLARRAVAKLPEGQVAHCTLALAGYRAGYPDEALAAARKALRLPSKMQDAFAGFVITMLEARRGELDAAKAQFAASTVWLEKNHAQCKECRKLRGEAQQVLSEEAAKGER